MVNFTGLDIEQSGCEIFPKLEAFNLRLNRHFELKFGTWHS